MTKKPVNEPSTEESESESSTAPAVEDDGIREAIQRDPLVAALSNLHAADAEAEAEAEGKTKTKIPPNPIIERAYTQEMEPQYSVASDKLFEEMEVRLLHEHDDLRKLEDAKRAIERQIHDKTRAIGMIEAARAYHAGKL